MAGWRNATPRTADSPNFETGQGIPAWQLKVEGYLLEVTLLNDSHLVYSLTRTHAASERMSQRQGSPTTVLHPDQDHGRWLGVRSWSQHCTLTSKDDHKCQTCEDDDYKAPQSHQYASHPILGSRYDKPRTRQRIYGLSHTYNSTRARLSAPRARYGIDERPNA